MPDLRPLRVAQTTSQLLKAQHLKQQPVWLPVVARTPPISEFDRKLPPSFHTIRTSKKGKIRRVFDIQRVRYMEDGLRERFYEEHPWELARPVLLTENDGNDSKNYDWSKIEQPGKQLSGESVVQRQMYLMTQASPKFDKDQAYRKACEEFYKLRTIESVEKRIAVEEAMAFGARFNKSQTEIGLELEDKVVAQWRKQALQARNLVQPNILSQSPVPKTFASDVELENLDTSDVDRTDVFAANLY